MHPEIENLVKIALSDGVLTIKEQEILKRKAKSLNIDIDEFEMELEYLISQQDIEVHSSEISKKTDIKRSFLQDLIDKFQTIDDEIANPQKEERTTGDRLENTVNKTIDNLLGDNLINVGVDAVTGFFGGETSTDKKERKAIQQEYHRISLLTSKKATIVSTYPSSKNIEELIEFANLSATNYQALENKLKVEEELLEGENDLLLAWRSKAQQILNIIKTKKDIDESNLAQIETIDNIIYPKSMAKKLWNRFKKK